jgi:hypothetical protein
MTRSHLKGLWTWLLICGCLGSLLYALWLVYQLSPGDCPACPRASEHLEVECEWAGGVRTRHALVRPVRRFEHLRGFDQILTSIRELRQQGCSATVIAEKLNAAGWHPQKRPALEAGMIQRLMFRHGMTAGRPIWSRSVPRQPGAEWTL